MKQYLAIVLSILLAISLVACNGASSDTGTDGQDNTENSVTEDSGQESPAAQPGGGDVVVKFWSFHTGGEADFLTEAVASFNEMDNGIFVEHEVVSQSDYITTLIPTAYANGEAPDILYVEPSTFTKYAERGMLADLTAYYTEELKADVQPAALEAVTFDGQILALPMEMETLGLFYNADMLADAGIAPPKTWDELYQAAAALTTDDVYGIVLPVEDSGYTLFNWWPFMWMTGAELLSEDRTQSVADSPAMAEALDFWGRFFQEGLAPSSLQIGPWDIGNVGTGLAAMQVGGTYMINDAEELYDVDIQVVPLPAPAGRESITVAGGQKMAINAQSENKDEAAQFIFWLYGDTEDITLATKWVSEAKFAYPARFSVIDANEALYGQGLRADFTAFYGSAVPEPSYSSEINEAMGEALQNVMFAGTSGESAAQALAQAIDATL